jgi:hypothetical protein
MQPKFQIYPERRAAISDPPSAPQWRWRFIAGNGKNTANGSEGYAGESNVRRAVHAHCDAIMDVCGIVGASSYPPIEVVDQ